MKHVSLYIFVLSLLLVSVPAATAQSSCSEGGSQAEMDLYVPNLTDQNISVYWNNFQCQEELKDIIPPGGFFYQRTYDGHEWLFRNEVGATVMEFTASAGTSVAVLGGESYNSAPVNSNCSSAGTDEKVRLTITNNITDPVLAFWIDTNCTEQLYAVVNGGDEIVQRTFAGHDWVVRFADGRPAKQLTVSAADNIIVIDSTEALEVTETPDENFPVTESGCEVTPVTADMGYDDFYAKYCDYNGLVIASSEDVDDEALEQAWLIAANVLYKRPDVVESLVNLGFQIVVVSEAEFMTDVPELAYLADDPEVDYDNFRGYDKVLEEPRLVATAQENLLCSPRDTNRSENLLVNSLGNLTRFALVMDLEPGIGEQVEAARQNAINTGLWSPEMTDSNGAYWNYGVQTYFNSSALLTGPVDEFTNTRSELADYDPQLYELINSVYNNSAEWAPVCP